MKAIVAVDSNWGIGFKGKLLQRIPEDMKNFRRMTTGKVVVMGRETFESLPGQEPLKDRVNVVLSRDLNFSKENVTICRSMEELFRELEKYNSDDVFVIGGESIYRQLLKYCDEVYVTKIHRAYEADRFFPELDKEGSWKEVYVSNMMEYQGVLFNFSKYIKQ